ncbi:MAG: hypothetical protein LC122_03630 [Chitinophagales bacterium]|nr:hypothetical protein [Chitinophagales bacterium]
MRIDINPFFSRPSETIGENDKFIQLFSPDVLDIFDGKKPLWDIVNIIRSSPGGGKTTLLKLFTPDILLRIKNKHKDEQHLLDIYKRLKFLGVYDDRDNPLLISTHIPFTNEYSTLEYLDIGDANKEHLFFSLLNTRIILAVLYSFCRIKDIDFPEGLNKLIVNQNPAMTGFNPLRNIINGKDIYDWCCENEEKICSDIDNVTLANTHEVDKILELYSLHLFDTKNLIYDGFPVKERILIMLDDVHNLSHKQRNSLMKNIIDRRPLVNVWIAERLQALTMEEIISEGNITNRDLVFVNLEQFWSRGNKFQKFVNSVAEKRLSIIAEGESTNFASYLSEIIGKDFNETAVASTQIIKDKLYKNFNIEKYAAWLNTREEFIGNEIETLVEWRRLEILIDRDHGNSQQLLQFEEFLDENSLIKQDGSDIENAARLFLHEEYKIPYYYGIDKISRLASSNIEQFLNISGKLFEAITLNQLKKISQNNSNSVNISPKKQDQLIKKLTNEKWKELDIRVPKSTQVKIFLDNIGSFCREQTYTRNAWNSPGINGIAITMQDRDILKNKAIIDSNHHLNRVANIIALCIAYNLLDFRLNYKVQGKEVMILYLNRIYCSKYGLPLNNGKFKVKRLSDLNLFLDKKQKNLFSNT